MATRIKIEDLDENAKVSSDEMKAICGGGISIFGGGTTQYTGSNCGISVFGGGASSLGGTQLGGGLLDGMKIVGAYNDQW